MPRRPARVLGAVIGAVVAAQLLAGCSGGPRAGAAPAVPPQVTFSAGGQSITARPTQYCDVRLQDCTADAAAPVTLAVPPGTPLTVDVPADVAATPWHVVFSYTTAAGEAVDERTTVFPPDAREDYVLTLPGPADLLVTAEVQQFGAGISAGEQGSGVDFAIRGSWVLRTS